MTERTEGPSLPCFALVTSHSLGTASVNHGVPEKRGVTYECEYSNIGGYIPLILSAWTWWADGINQNQLTTNNYTKWKLDGWNLKCDAFYIKSKLEIDKLIYVTNKLKAEHPSCVERNTLKWKLISQCTNALKHGCFYLAGIGSEMDVLLAHTAKTSEIKAGESGSRGTCVCIHSDKKWI